MLEYFVNDAIREAPLEMEFDSKIGFGKHDVREQNFCLSMRPDIGTVAKFSGCDIAAVHRAEMIAALQTGTLTITIISVVSAVEAGTRRGSARE